MKGYITLNEHFILSDEEKRQRDTVSLFMSYDELYINKIKEELSLRFNVNKRYGRLVFGQVIIIEQILSSSLPEQNKIAMCLSIFYRPIDESVFDNDDEEKEQNMINEWLGLPAGLALSMFDNITALRNAFFFEQYDGVVYKKSSGKKNEKNVAMEEDTFEDVFYKNFGWYERVRNIAKELNMTISQANMMSADEAMMELAYQVSKSKLTEFQKGGKKK